MLHHIYVNNKNPTFKILPGGYLVPEELHHGGVVSVLGAPLHYPESPESNVQIIKLQNINYVSLQFITTKLTEF